MPRLTLFAGSKSRQALVRVFALALAAQLCAFAQTSQPATSPALVALRHQPLLLGSAWYPEQWPESRWDADLTLMEQAHMHVVRVGEFAWSSLEPSEGHFELDWLDRAIALAAKHHIAVVIGTPTDAPPAWLTQKYPETLGVDADGRRREHGSRRQFNYANPKYRELCRIIVAQLGRRFGHNIDVIGWQIGNEYTDESFDPATRKQFQEFLRARYHTLDSLNQHWTTAYWSQTYTDWSQIPLENTRGNPGLLLEHKHFVTATWRSFQRNQIDALRPLIDPRQFITTNIGGLAWSDNWDHYAMTADLDLASWDDYVGQGHLDVTKNAMLNDFARGWRRQNFWIMETEPGSVNWAPVSNALNRGETRALAWQTIGHGADAVVYWQWRAALNGQEQYHGALVGPDGTPLPIYSEIAQLGDDFDQIARALAGTTPQSEIAILHTYDSRWAIDFQPHTNVYDQQKVLLRFYGPLDAIAQSSGHQIDIIDPTRAPLDGYQLLVAPSLNVISDALAAKLLAYVRSGGHLLLGPRSGMKDEYDALNTQRQPGPLVPALGARVEQFYALDKPLPLQLPDAQAQIWAEDLRPRSAGTQIDLRYGNSDFGWLNSQPAMVIRRVGKGTIAYLGTLPDDATLSNILISAANHADVAPGIFTLPAGIELCVRRPATAKNENSEEVFILINHTQSTSTVRLPGRFRSLLAPTPSGNQSGASTDTVIHLPPQGVAVVTPQTEQHK